MRKQMSNAWLVGLHISIALFVAFAASACALTPGAAPDKTPDEMPGGMAGKPAPSPAPAFQFLKTQGSRIVRDDGEPARLRGVNLGNWLLLEMWMLDIDHAVIPDQFTFESILEKRFGAAEKDRLMEVFRENWITPRDFTIIQSFGMNVVRLPIHYNLLMDDTGPLALKPGAWKWIDRAVDLAREHGCYSILDLHGAPGCQTKDHTTGRVDLNRFWTNPDDQERTIWLWRQIAARYAGRPEIAAYDLLNEPWGATSEELKAIITRLYAAVREVDKRHILLIPSHYREIDFHGAPRERGWENVAFTMHFYPGLFGNGRPTPDTQVRFLTRDLAEWDARMARLDAPLMIGEFNVVRERAGGAEMMRRHFDAYASRGWPATMWSYKVIRRAGGLGEDSWGMAANRNPLDTVDVREWPAGRIEAFFRSLSTMPYSEDENLRHWLTSSDTPSALTDPGPEPRAMRKPPSADAPPEGWRATEIGRARPGGQEIAAPNHWILYGAGRDIYAERDQFHYVWTKVRGDFTLSARAAALEDVHDFAKAGLMARSSLADDSPHVFVAVKPDGSIEWSDRATTHGVTKTEGGPRLEFPSAHLRLARRDGVFRLECSTDGAAWTTSKTLAPESLGHEIYVGFAALSHENSQLARAEFADIQLDAPGRIALTDADANTGETLLPFQDLPPCGWEITDMNNAKPGAFQRISDSDFDIFGGGTDLWDDADQCRFMWRAADGDFALEADIHELQNAHPFAKAALMIREDLSPAADCRVISVFPNGTVQMASREGKDALMAAKSEYKCAFPDIRLRLLRRGDSILLGFRSAGGGWTESEPFKSPSQPGGRALVGIAVLSHDDSVLARARIRNLSFDAPLSPAP